MDHVNFGYTVVMKYWRVPFWDRQNIQCFGIRNIVQTIVSFPVSIDKAFVANMIK